MARTYDPKRHDGVALDANQTYLRLVEEGREALAQVRHILGDGFPSELTVWFPWEDPTKNITYWNKRYTRYGRLWCRCDGRKARIRDKTGRWSMEDCPVDDDGKLTCEHLGTACRLIITVNLFLPDLPFPGLWQMESRSINMLRSMTSEMETYQPLFGLTGFDYTLWRKTEYVGDYEDPRSGNMVPSMQPIPHFKPKSATLRASLALAGKTKQRPTLEEDVVPPGDEDDVIPDDLYRGAAPEGTDEDEFDEGAAGEGEAEDVEAGDEGDPFADADEPPPPDDEFEPEPPTDEEDPWGTADAAAGAAEDDEPAPPAKPAKKKPAPKKKASKPKKPARKKKARSF